MTESSRGLSVDGHVAVCLNLARAGIPPDLIELLVQGDPLRGIAPLALDRAISSALQAEGMAVVPGWQPIESAPKDGKRIWVALPGGDSHCEPAEWRVGCWWGVESGWWKPKDWPTHWQPLPAPPASPYGKPVVKEKDDE